MTEYGKFLARVQGPVSGNVLLRREQYRRADSPEQSAEIARSVVIAKVANGRTGIMRAAREHDNPAAEKFSPERLRTGPACVDAGKIVFAARFHPRRRGGRRADVLFGFRPHDLSQKDAFFFRERTGVLRWMR
jgi:CRISPR-associated protein Cas1